MFRGSGRPTLSDRPYNPEETAIEINILAPENISDVLRTDRSVEYRKFF